MMRFVAGLTKFEGIRKEAVKQVILVEDRWSGESRCPELRWLDLAESMEITRGGQSDLTHFCQWLPTCRLKTFILQYLLPHNIEMVSRALTAVPSLKTLDMVGSEFTLQSMQAFASMLQQNQSLTKVDISHCSIDSDSACCLARALHSNTTLTELNMWGNSVGERGALAMAEMLKHNTTLTELVMFDATIGVEGAKALVESLAVNHHLNRLWISKVYKKEVEALPAYHTNKKRIWMMVWN